MSNEYELIRGVYQEAYDEFEATLSSEFFCSEDAHFYHYTSVGNFLNIMKHDKENVFTMYASQLRYCNDKEEYSNGNSIINTEIDSLDNIDFRRITSLYDKEFDLSIGNIWSDDVYVICFCGNGDLLSQWKYYGKDSGIAIEFNLNQCVFGGFCEAKYDTKGCEGIIYRKAGKYKIVYDDDTKDRMIKEQILKIERDMKLTGNSERLVMRDLCQLKCMFPPLFKHKSFIDEAESRLLFRPLYHRDPFSCRNKIFYIEKNGKIVPHMKIRIKGKDKKTPVILSLTVGPGHNQELIYEAIKHFVGNQFNEGITNLKPIDDPKLPYTYEWVNGIEIRKSKTPFRD